MVNCLHVQTSRLQQSQLHNNNNNNNNNSNNNNNNNLYLKRVTQYNCKDLP